MNSYKMNFVYYNSDDLLRGEMIKIKNVTFFTKTVYAIVLALFVFNGESLFSMTFTMPTQSDFFNEVKFGADCGAGYGVYDDLSGTGDTIHETMMDDRGNGIFFQYSIIFDFDKSSRWRNKPLLGMGLLTDFSAVYSNDSSLFSAGVAGEVKLFWILSGYYGLAYDAFSKDLTYEDQSGNSKSRSFSGVSQFMGFGFELPITSRYDLFLNYMIYGNNFTNEYDEYWERESVRIGIVLKL